MATSNPSSRMHRLGLFTSKAGPSKPGPPSPLSRDGGDGDEDEDWYIPYNGPYEQQPGQREESRGSWGELLNGWLSDEDSGGKQRTFGRDGRSSQAASAPEDRTRSRVVSNSTRHTQSTTGRAPHLRSDPQPRVPTMSFINLDQAGGVGQSPMPPERASNQPHDPPTSSQPAQPPLSLSKRASLASIFTFGRKSLRMSVSMENFSHPFKRDRSNTDGAPPPPPVPPTTRRGRARAYTTNTQQAERVSDVDEYYNSYYSTLLNTPGNEGGRGPADGGSALRSHPYAYPFPETAAPEPHSAPAALDKGKGRLLHTPKISFNLLDPRGASKDIPAYLKPSPRSSLLKASVSTPNLRNIPKGKQRWWAAESWCDAIILPRPRFALRFVDPSGSGRIVSPPPSPIMFPSQTPTMQRRPEPPESKSPQKVRSMGNLIGSPSSPREKPEDIPPAAESSTRKALRPKSFAWDDLALPSPVPSLAKVLEEGRQLEDQRKHWQTKASNSFLDKRAGTMSRARSKSIGASQSRSRGHSKDPESAFERLAERTLLGAQMRPPTIHVRGPSVSKSREQSQTQTQTHTGTVQGTVPSTSSNHLFSRTGSRARSHAHSNSLGNSLSWKSSSNESGGGHSRSQSMGKSALKLVVTTATSAAVLCGLSSNPSDKGSLSSPLDEKGSDSRGLESGAVHTREQAQSGVNASGNGNVIVISPTSASAALAMVSREGMSSVSPTPSALSGSAEVGLAFSSPSEDHSRQQGKEPIRFPGHPYARGFGNNLTSAATGAGYLSPPGQEQAINAHRQPVLIHPYSQPGHPYASPSHPTPNMHNHPQNVTIPPNMNTTNPNTNLYAELSPGHVREFAPEQIRYSPDMPNPPVVVRPLPPPPPPPATTLTASGHPYGPSSKRTSELGFGEALMHTMRRASVDSGLGTSESGGLARGIDWERPTIDISADNDMDDIVRIHQAPQSTQDNDYFAARGRSMQRRPSDENETTASSPLENVNPPLFRRTTSGLSAGRLSSKSMLNSSGSSPGMVSHDSSPPLSPRPINTHEDLDRFRDLFYKPPDRSDTTSDDFGRQVMDSRRPSGSIPVDVSSQSARSALTRSGLSDLARQLSEDLEELRQERGSGFSDDSQRWGTRFAGLRGIRPEDMEDPNVVLAHLTSTTDSPNAYHSPLRLPIDTSFVSPATNIPEDIESSRASSILELTSIPDHLNELVRMGEVEAVSTPPIVSSPHRASTQLSVYDDDPAEYRSFSGNLGPPRVVSQHSTLLTPRSPNTRSSYMTTNTDTSRMSGLSDFPAPPSQVIPIATSSGNTLNVPPRLVREISYGTFGRQTDDEHSIVGEAL